MNTESLSLLNCESLLKTLSRKGIYLKLWGKGVRVFSFEGKQLSDEDRELIKAHKDMIIDYLFHTKKPVSFSQQRLWFLDRYDEGKTTTYHMPMVFHLQGRLDVEALEWALNQVVERHEILRTYFSDEAGECFQVILPQLTLKLEVERCKPEILETILEQEIHKLFDLAKGPLIRARLFQLKDQSYVFSLCQHHIITDGWSLGILWHEIIECYLAYLGKRPINLSELPIQYADYARWQRQQFIEGQYQKQLAYWKKQLCDIEPLQLSTDKPRPVMMSYHGASIAFSLDAQITKVLRQLARSYDTSLFAVLLAVINVVLSCYARQNNICVGTAIANRTHEAIEPLLGFFVNTLVMRNEVSPELTFSQFLKQVTQTALDAYANQDIPFEQLVDELKIKRDTSRHPIFQVMFMMQNFSHQHNGGQPLPGLAIETMSLIQHTAKFDLKWDFREVDTKLECEIEYCVDLFEQQTIERMFEHFKICSQMVMENHDQPLGYLSLMTEQERQQVLHLWNQTQADFPQEHTIAQIFQAQAVKTPHHVAVVFEDKKLTYRELNQQSNQFARYLQTLGVGEEVLVAIALERSVEMVISLLAILKAGGAYVPLDPGYPIGRLAFMMEDTQAPVLITQKYIADKLPATQAQIVYLDDGWQKIRQYSKQSLVQTSSLDNIAYVIYTSGSTGQPKGVLIDHRGVMNHLYWRQREFRLKQTDKVLHKAPFSCDVPVWEILWSFMVGACTVLAKPGGHRDSAYLAQLIAKEAITTIHFVPSMLALFVQEPTATQLNSLRQCFCGAETLTPALQQAFFTKFPAVKLYNVYGSSEIINTTYWHCRPIAHEHIHVCIGEPIANIQVYVLDMYLQPVPIGVPGELCIAGLSLARGYLNRAELTSEQFIENLFATKEEGISGKNSRLYKTGDMARFLADGNIEFLGRIDNQVKLRGFRIELGDIEANLLQHENLQAATVVLQEQQDHEKKLIAYWVAVQNKKVDVAELRSHLSKRLPDHMLPAAFVQLEALPVTPSGKIDRKSLPAVDENVSVVHYVPPRNELEVTLTELWAEVLKIKQVGIEDNFFEIGGHSLLTIRLVKLINRHFQCNLAVRQIFAYPTIASISPFISQVDQTIETWPTLTIDDDHKYDPFSLTQVQQAYWVGRQGGFTLGQVGTHRYTEFDFSHLDVARLEKALNQLIGRHAMLRMVIDKDGQQRILKKVEKYRIFKQQIEHADDKKLLAWREALSHQVFEPSHWPMFEFRVSNLPDRARLHISIDALIFDARSSQIFFSEWAKLYIEPDYVLPPLAITFRDYMQGIAAIKQTELYQQHKNYWLQRLPHLPLGPELPLKQLPSQISKPHFARCRAEIAQSTWEVLKHKAIEHSVSATSVLLSSFAFVLARWSKHAHFLINLTLFNRLPLHDDVDRIIGDFTSLELLEVNFEQGQKHFAAQVRALHERLWSDLEHRLFDGIALQREMVSLHGQDIAGQIAPVVFTSILNAGQNADSDQMSFKNIEFLGNAYSISQTSQVWIDNKAYESQGKLIAEWDYVAALFPDGMIEAIHKTYCTLIEQLATLPWDAPIPELLPETDAQLIDRVNATRKDYALACLHEPIINYAKTHPDAIAIIDGNGPSLNYGEVIKRASQISHALHKRGCKANQLVAVVMEKGWQQTVACLAILQSGAAYLPIHANWPVGRMCDVLAQGKVAIILSQKQIARSLKNQAELSSYQWWAVDDENMWDAYPTKPLALALNLDDIAYVIFTSGSTGKPKGVSITHRGAMNTLMAVNERFAIGEQDVVLGLSELSFDLSVYDIFGVLSVGGTLVIPEIVQAKEPAHWLELIEQHQISIFNSVPMFMQMLVTYLQSLEQSKLYESLRLVLLSGDWIPPDLAEQIKNYFPRATQMSLGGATEGSIWSIWRAIKDADSKQKSIPYGKAMPNQQMLILNQALQACPVHTTGEIYIGGVGVALGYWGDEAKTKACFITHPATGERLYKTGDLGRLLADGNIEFIGREDFQVKVSGHRIELGEIEQALKTITEIKEAVVEPVGEKGQYQQLAAYLVVEETGLGHHAEIVAESDRKAFKLSQHYLRAFAKKLKKIQLAHNSDEKEKMSTCFARKSYRRFEGRASISKQVLRRCIKLSGPNQASLQSGTLYQRLGLSLECIMGYQQQGLMLPKYRYPSAGSLYPVQVYITVHRSLDNLSPGNYYYHPHQHCLIKINSATKIFSQKNDTTLSMHLVANHAAIFPLYGDLAERFCQIEAGHMLALLKRSFTTNGLAMNPVHINTQAMHKSLALDKADSLVSHFAILEQPQQTIKPQTAALTPWFYFASDQIEDLAPGLYQYRNRQFKHQSNWQPELSQLGQYTENGQIISQAAGLMIFTGEANSANYQHAGELAQYYMENSTADHIGMCPLGNIDAIETLQQALNEQVLYILAFGSATQAQIASTQTSEVIQQRPDLSLILEQYLTQTLPAYMIPAHYQMLSELPLTANGKVDRKALPAPDTNLMSNAYVPASNEIEATLSEIWADVLHVERAGIHDNFFHIGGNSLLATQVISRIRTRFGCELQVRLLFEQPTISQLARVVQAQAFSSESTPIEPIDHSDLMPMSYAQQRLWFIDRYEGGRSIAYNIPLHIRLQGKLNIGALESALNHLIDRHESLRAIFVEQSGIGYQQIKPTIKLKINAEPAQQTQLSQLLTEESHRPFDLSQGPLIRVRLFKLDEQQHVLSITQHHIISDGWSVGIFWREFITTYNALINDKPIPLAKLTVQYADFAHWQRQQLSGEGYQKQLSYWQQQLIGVEPLNIATDKPRPKMMSHRGAAITFSLDQDMTKGLHQLARNHNTSLYAVLLTAFNILLSRYSGQSDICVGTPIANRHIEAIEPLLGFFVNTLVMRNQISEQSSFSQLLEQVSQTALDAYAHQDIPFEKLVEELKIERNISRSPLFQVMLVLQNFSYEQDLSLPSGLEGELLVIAHQIAKFDLVWSFQESDSSLVASIEYCIDLFKQTGIERMVEHFKILLQNVIKNSEQLLSEFSLLTEQERQQILYQWNQTHVEFPSDKTIVHLFQQQAVKTPDNLAVVFEDKHLTYRELDDRSNQLAHYLRDLGVDVKVLVAIAVERSLEMVIGLLGILKAGAAYLPLDPEYPQQRLAYMLEDSQASLLISQTYLLRNLPKHKTETICLDKQWNDISQYSQQAVKGHLDAEHSAYVIYTSGSTGQPKGVMLAHRGVVNFLSWKQQKIPLTSQDKVLQKTPISFDVSVGELFWPLITGAQLILAQPGGHRDSAYLVKLIKQLAISVIHFVPSMLAVFLTEQHVSELKSLRYCISGGEALSLQVQKSFLAKLPHVQLYNFYGPTEASIDVTCWDCTKQYTGHTIPIGRPIANAQTYILDKEMQAVAISIPGELHLGGIGLALGYLNHPELTQERFIDNPFVSQQDRKAGTNLRLYKTGDLARFLPEGHIEFLGRIDTQVKLRGFRIELGEIEAKLVKHEAVQVAVVVMREEQSGEKRLVAYWVAVENKTADLDKLRIYLQKYLPDHMIPALFIQLEALPLTPNGKLDRKALPAIDKNAMTQSYVAPRDKIESKLARIWGAVLGVEQVGIYDNFFTLGGHSLLAINLINQIKAEFHVSLPLKVVFEAQTLAQMAQHLVDRKDGASWSPLVAIQPKGTRLPIFCVHPAGGSVFKYFNLAADLGLDQPLFGLQARGLEEGQTPYESIEEMTESYIEAIRKVQPTGPYCLMGWSLGGRIAYEIAQQLGNEVGHLFLIDAPSYHKTKARSAKQNEIYLIEHFFGEHNVQISQEKLVEMTRNKRLAYVLKLGKQKNIIQPHYGVTDVGRILQLFHKNVTLVSQYQVQPYSGKMTLFIADKSDEIRREAEKDKYDETFGWKNLVSGGLDVYIIPGSHATILEKPNSKVLAKKLKIILDKQLMRLNVPVEV